MAFGSQRISLVERSRSSFCSCCVYPVCRWGSSSSFLRWCQRGLSLGGPDRWGLGSLLGLTGVGHPMELTPFYGEGRVLDVREIASAKLYSIFWSALLASTSVNLIHGTQIVITTSELKYHGIVCLCVAFAHSRFIENPLIWSWEMNPSFLRWFCHNVGWSIFTELRSWCTNQKKL
jgi:hypothetical protein